MSFKIFGVVNNEPLERSIFDILLTASDPGKRQLILSQKIKSNADNSVIGIALAKYALMSTYNLQKKRLSLCIHNHRKALFD